MIKRILIISLLFIGILNAANLSTNKSEYRPNNSIVVNYSQMAGNDKNWIAIYPSTSSNDWDNVIQWDWIGVGSGTHTFNALPVGNYEVRAFYNNSYHVEASKSFSVKKAVTLTLSKTTYKTNQKPKVTFKNMSGDAQDWIAIYPAGSSNDWDNVIQWDWAGAVNGIHTFNALPEGNYEVRAFFNNSYNLEKSKAFTVNNGNANQVTLSLGKSTYKTNEKPKVTFKNMSGNSKDWIAIFSVGSSNNWDNVIQWDWAGSVNGTHTFNKLPAGNYEVRAFFNNSYNVEASKSFTVKNIDAGGSKIYENAENGLNPNWVHVSGHYAPIHYNGGGFQSNGALVMVPEWKKVNGYWTNQAEYLLPLNANASRKVLELDIGGLGNYQLPNEDGNHIGYIPHYNISIRMHTTDGSRRVIWDSSYNHNGITEPFTSAGGYLIHSPSPIEHVRGWYEPDVFKWEHFKVNIESLLQQMEPNNSITSIDSISFTGGFIDNIELSPN